MSIRVYLDAAAMFLALLIARQRSADLRIAPEVANACLLYHREVKPCHD